jgi:hypothetical protein
MPGRREAVFVLNEPAGTAIEINVESDTFVATTLVDVNGETVLGHGAQVTMATLSGPTKIEGPHFLTLYSRSPGNSHIVSNRDLVPYTDPDDGRSISSGDTVLANMDYQSDTDRYTLVLLEGESIRNQRSDHEFQPRPPR